MSEPLSPAAFEAEADRTIADIAERVETALDDADVEIQGGILTIALADGRQFLLNKHGPNRQLWLSSPISGGWHFERTDQGWTATRGGRSLAAILGEELSVVIGP